MSTAEPSPSPSTHAAGCWRRRAIWTGLYVAVMAAVVFSLIQFRRVALETMGTPEAQAEWQEWRDSEPNQSDDLPVQRRAPKSPEPPLLVLMRDHFAVVMTGAILFSSLLYAALAIAAWGAFARQRPTP
ncbi:MAG: hypothetical protein DWQ37_07230 [Planctomycetota bacterium]|nr:MAG: hypothetical protein DWQ37_07230 [Planctomycetota bacterium]